MKLARVKGTVVCTRKNAGMQGVKLLVIQPVDERGKVTEPPLIATDSIGAGAGELVFYCSGREATIPFDTTVPTDACITGIVDSVYLRKK